MRTKILLMLPNWVGDAVMATPAVRAIRERFPRAELIGAGRTAIAAVLDGNPWLDRFVLLDRRPVNEFRTAWKLRREHIDLAVLFPNSLRSALYSFVAGCRHRIGFARHGRDVLLSERLFVQRGSDGRPRPCPMVSDYNRLAVAGGAAVRSSRLELFTVSDDETAADDVWSRFRFHAKSEVVCLNPGAAFGSAKLWPAKYFADIARRFAIERGAGVLVLCGPAERDLARRIEAIAAHPHVHSLARESVSIGLSKSCVRRCDLLVTTDSGPRHFAAAFDKPVVALFGPTHIDWTLTDHAKEVRLQRRVPCGPCQRRECHLDHRCMRELKADDVYAAAVGLLDTEACGVP